MFSTVWSISLVLVMLVLFRFGSFLRISSNLSQSVFLTRRICLGSCFCPVVISNIMYLWSEFENRSLTCQLLIRSPPVGLVMVRSITELCPLELRKVGVDPLFAQDSPKEERKSSSSLPLSLHTRLPHRVWWEFVSDPIMSGRLLSMAYFASGVDSVGGAGPVISM